MHANLGSRKRFLFRMIVYGLAPWVGLYVFFDNPDRIEGRLLGIIGIAVGSLAIYLLFTRLKDPLGALRYALRPLGFVTQLVEDWSLKRSDLSLGDFLSERLPDVIITERRCPGDGEGALLAVGEELLIYLSPVPQTQDEVETLITRLEELRTPLQEEDLIIVLPEISETFKTLLLRNLRHVHLIVSPKQPL